MKTRIILLIAIFSIGIITCSNNQKTDKNSIFSKQYRDIHEFQCFKDYTEIGAAIIGETTYDYSISQLKNHELNVLLLNKVLPGPKSTFEIIDTLQIRNLRETEYISYQICRKDSVPDSEIIAIVLFDNAEYFSRVLKAWRANRKTGQIIEIETKGIDCLNEGYGI